ncbi:MAG: dicarboxylate/amino acid:cation symporter [Candidatus Sphingomonas colombiensis]|nr:dicarboxylate/amino acid:cation symporter [Sphingomonas sp.]WEK42892.1 MAG: dicarboxylate/amino acid:cation symporter [Sphingomonas sp.]
MTIMRAWFGIPLWKRVLGGLFAGVTLGLLWPDAAPWIAFVGEVFMRLIRMLVVPVVFITIASGVTSLGDPKRLGAIGGRTVGLFAATTVIAVLLGMSIALLVEPGKGAQLAGVTAHPLGAAKSVHDQLVGIVPTNVIEALVQGDMLAIIFFALLVGIGTTLAREDGRPLAALLQSAASMLFRVVELVMEVTPFGVAALIANAIATNGTAVFVNIGWLAGCVLIGAVAQMLLVHSAMLAFVARVSPLGFFRGIMDALVVAFSTASSSATLPVALRVATEYLGLPRPIVSTVLPVGASIGKDGTAMYVGLLSVFALQALGITPTIEMLGMMLLTGALAAFGTAPIPSASLFMLAAVLAAVGVSAEQTALVVGLVLPFDRLLDMTRTVPSASANLTIATLVARWEGTEPLAEEAAARQPG